ncbi:MAG: NYN domain-containing protein [Chthoniobacterales bacterium]
MKRRFLLVDGHSVIFQWQGLSNLHGRKPEHAREALARILRDYQDSSDFQVVLVFDGQGPRVSQSKEEGNIQIFYSKTGQSADAVIERLTAKYAETHEITVATDDNLERQTVTSFGGQWMSTTHLLSEMEDARRSLAERIEKNNIRRRPLR